MPDPTPIERALCCGLLCGRHKPEHGECQASTYGRRKREALEAAGHEVLPVGEIASLRTVAAQLAEALQPFAAIAEALPNTTPDDAYLHETAMIYAATIGMCRIARAAIAAKGQGQ